MGMPDPGPFLEGGMYRGGDMSTGVGTHPNPYPLATDT